MNARAQDLIVLGAGALLMALVLDAFVITRCFECFSLICFDSAFYMLVIWAAGWLTATALVTLFIFQLLKYQKPLFAQAVCLTAVTINLILIFSICPMDLFKPPEDNPPPFKKDSTAEKLLIEEHKKAVEEIKNRDLEEDSWFHNKFILVGGLLAATLGYIGFGGSKSPPESPGESLATLSKSPSTAVILALASVLALGVDMHIRANMCETDQLGLWIRYYVEPVAFDAKPPPENAAWLPLSVLPFRIPPPKPAVGDSKSSRAHFCGWEEFLRESTPPVTKTVDWKDSEGAALHTDELQSLLYDPHIHFLTVFVYILYLAVFQTFARPTGTGLTSDARVMLAISFVIVQASFFAFAWIAHSAPEMFELKVLPFLDAYQTGYLVPQHYFVPCLALVILNIPYLCLLSPKWTIE